MSNGYTPSTRPRVLVVGAREGSLGSAVGLAATRAGYDVFTAGISGEAIKCDALLMGHEAMVAMLSSLQPRFVVSTVGLNMPKPGKQIDLFDWYRWHFETNVIANMRLLAAYQEAAAEPGWLDGYCHFIGISSNSASIPRTRSAAYCASKAALSMALRTEAREGARNHSPIVVYGYEPGLLRGTPMTVDSTGAFVGKLHRMIGDGLEEGIEPSELAEFIVNNMRGGPALNGLMIKYDADEL